MPTDDAIEQQIQAKGLTAPRVTPADVKAAVRSAEYLRHGLLTICILTLQNGFTVTGESACASPENFNEEIGKQIAHTNAQAKIWPLLGYALREKLYRTSGL